MPFEYSKILYIMLRMALLDMPFDFELSEHLNQFGVL